jgi:hypothetical protein
MKKITTVFFCLLFKFTFSQSLPSSAPTVVYVNDFGADPTGQIDCSDAIDSALVALQPARTNWGIQSYGQGTVRFKRGIYKCSRTINIRSTVILEGDGAGFFPYQEVQLNFLGTSGIDIRATNNGFGARSVTIRNLSLRNFLTSTDSSAHGLFTNTRVIIDNCGFDNFSGNGISIVTSDSGNANNSILQNVTCYYNGKNGLFLAGNESNHWRAYNCDFTANGQCGILDYSFLGGMAYGCHTSFNGVRVATGWDKSWCTYNGKVYQAIKYPSQIGIEPTVSPNWNQYWVLNSTVFGTVSPAQWSASNTYWITGSYVVAGTATASSFFGCYSEGGQGANIMNQFSICWGGDQGAIFSSPNDIWISSNAYQVLLKGAGIKIFDADSVKTFSGFHNKFGLQLGSEKSGHSTFQEKYYEADRTLKFFADNSTGNQSFYFIGKGYNPAKLGISTLPWTGSVVFPYYSGFYMQNALDGNMARNISASTGNPNYYHGNGDLTLNISTDTNYIAHKTLISGNPGISVKLKTGNFMLGYYTPSACNDPVGKLGDMCFDDNFFYVKTNQGWKKLPFELICLSP